MGENSFQERIRLLVDDLGISDRAFSASIGQSTSYLNTSKKENSSPRLSAVLKILDAYPNLSLYWLVLGKGEMWLSDGDDNPESSNSVATKNRDYKSLFEEERKEIQELRKELHDSHAALVNLMDKNAKLQEENTMLKLSQIADGAE